MKSLWVFSVLFLSLSLHAQSVEQDAPVQIGPNAFTIYHNVTITQITSQNPHGPWSINGHVAVTGYVLLFARQADGDLHVPFCDSPHFVAPANGSALPDKIHCVMAEVVPYVPCAVITRLPSLQTIKGLMRYDGGTEWWEIHPIESMSGSTCHVLGTPTVE